MALALLLAHVQLAPSQHLQVLLCQTTFQTLLPRPTTLHRVVMPHVQHLALFLIDYHVFGQGPSIQPIQIPLLSFPTLKQINISTQLGTVHAFTEGAFDPLIKVTEILNKTGPNCCVFSNPPLPSLGL